MKGTNIDGDLSVGRNIVTGGNITSQGGALFKGDVHIAGWLDAKNIKWANKGLFASENELEEVYPKPLPGWYAIVIDQEDETKGFLYRALDGAWVVTSDTSHPYEFIMDSINVFVPKSDFDTLSHSVEKNSSDIEKFITGQTPVETARKLLTGLAYNGYVTPDTTLPVVDNVFYLTATAGDYIDREDNVISVHTEGVTLIQRKNGEWKTYALWELVSELNNASKTRFASAYAVKVLKDRIDQIATQGSVIVDSELSESSINPVQNAVITAALNELTTALSAGLRASLTATPNVVHKNTETQITLNGSLKDNAGDVVAADNILIKKGDEMIAEGTNKSSISETYSLNASSDTTFSADVNVKRMKLSAKATVSARNPVYAGMGTSATSVAVPANKQSARVSAKGYTYTKKATADGQYFFLLVPSDVTEPTTFTMGGAPFAMEPSSTETINEISYTVYRSSEVYNAGAEVNVTAN